MLIRQVAGLAGPALEKKDGIDVVGMNLRYISLIFVSQNASQVAFPASEKVLCCVKIKCETHCFLGVFKMILSEHC